jgi:hypothetical protein
MASLFSVSRLISKGRPASKRTSSDDEASTHPEAPQERTSYRPTNNKTEETLELPDYDVPLNISEKASSFEEWSDTGEEVIGPSEKEEYFQSGINENAKDSEERSLFSDTNWTPLDIDKKAEESPPIPSVLDWTDIEFDRGITSENHFKEQRLARLGEISFVKEEKRKLAERVKELEKELQDAVDELNLKMEQISKLIIDHDQKELEIEAALEKETSLLEKQDSMQKRMDMMIGELSESQARAAELKLAGEVQTKMLLEKDVILASHSDNIALLKRQKTNLIAKVQELKVESQARAAKLQSAGESAKKILRKHAILASCSDMIDLQKPNVIAQAEGPRATAKVDERQNCILLVQLGQKFSDGVVVYKGSVAKPVRCITGSTLVEHAVRIVKALNDKIYQFAASLTDCVDEIEKMPFFDSEESDDTVAASETLKSLLADTNICSQLENESHMTKGAYYPFILQTGIQICLTACCIHIITLWDSAQPEYGKFLEVVYKKIRGSGELSLFRPAASLGSKLAS